MNILGITLRVLLAIVFVALCAVTAISLAPFGTIAILAFRAGWIGTGLSVLVSITLNIWLLLWMVSLFQPQPEPCAIRMPRRALAVADGPGASSRGDTAPRPN